MNSTSLEIIFATSQKIGPTKATFLAYIIPPVMFQYLLGVMVQLEGTRLYRLAFLPVIVWFTCRAIFIVLSDDDPNGAQMNTMAMSHLSAVLMRCTVWAVAQERFRRHSPSNKQNKCDSESVCTALWNAWDLLLNTRGIGWNWSRESISPKPTFGTDSRIIFILLSGVRIVFHAFCFDACLQALRMLSPETFSSPNGGTLFGQTFPSLLELLRAIIASLLAICLSYFAIQWNYQFLAIVCTILFHQHPSQWPPIFDSPWLSTSLSELWGRRWHQMLRKQLTTFSKPLCYLLGRIGGLFGAFLFSGILHDLEFRSFGRGGHPVAIIGFWMMNGVGVSLECAWKGITGKRVDGVWGRVWTFGWLVLWGVLVMNAWAEAGRFGALSLPGGLEPSVVLVRLVRQCLVGSR